MRHCTVGDASLGTVFKDYKVGDGGTAIPANAKAVGLDAAVGQSHTSDGLEG